MELHGLLRITLLYPFLNDAPEWKAYALKRLQEEFSRQVYPDGFQYELATGYHGVVILMACLNASATRFLRRLPYAVEDYLAGNYTYEAPAYIC